MRVTTLESKADVFKEELDKLIDKTNYNPEWIKSIQLITYIKVNSILTNWVETKEQVPYCIAVILS